MTKKNRDRNRTREPDDQDLYFEPDELPEKHDNCYKMALIPLLDQEEVNSLLEASNSEYLEPSKPVNNPNYPTYTQEECAALISGIYYPRRSRRRK